MIGKGEEELIREITFGCYFLPDVEGGVERNGYAGDTSTVAHFKKLKM